MQRFLFGISINGERPEFDGKKPEFNGERPAFDGKKVELTDEQKAEMTAKMQEKLAQKLADGEITQEQYDEIIAAIQDGKMPVGMRMKGQSGDMGVPGGKGRAGGGMGNRRGNKPADAQ